MENVNFEDLVPGKYYRDDADIKMDYSILKFICRHHHHLYFKEIKTEFYITDSDGYVDFDLSYGLFTRWYYFEEDQPFKFFH